MRLTLLLETFVPSHAFFKCLILSEAQTFKSQLAEELVQQPQQQQREERQWDTISGAGRCFVRAINIILPRRAVHRIGSWYENL